MSHGTIYRPADAAGHPMIEPRFRTIDGLAIRFAESERRDGQDDALLLSPGPRASTLSSRCGRKLAETTHLVAIDLPGFGRSEGKAALMSPRAMGDFILRAADAFGLAHPHIVGPDVGTPAALFAAAAEPDRFLSLVVGTGGTAVPLDLGDPLREWVFAPDLEPYRRIGGRAIVERALQTLERYTLSAAAREDYLASYDGDRFAKSIRYAQSYPTELAAPPRPPRRRSETPVEIIAGRRDRIVPPVERRVPARAAPAQRTSSDRLRPLRLGGRRRRICRARAGLVGRRLQGMRRATSAAVP